MMGAALRGRGIGWVVALRELCSAAQCPGGDQRPVVVLGVGVGSGAV